MDVCKVIVIGAGNFGQRWLPLLTEYPGTEIAAVVDIVPDNLLKAKQTTGLDDNRLFGDLDKALREVEADMVLIVTPPQTHKTIVAKALQAGFHIMKEKPLAHNYEEAVELLTLSRNTDKIVMTSQNYRWRPVIQTMKGLLQNGTIGKVGYMEYSFRKALKAGQGWRTQYSEILLEDMAIHHFDIMRFLLEKEALEVTSHSFRPEWSWCDGNATSEVMILFQDNIHVHYFGSWISRGKQTTWNGDIRLVGEIGAIELLDDTIYVSLYDKEKETESYAVEPIRLIYEDRMASLDDMVEAIRNRTSPATSIADNIRSFEMTFASIESAKLGRKIVLEDYRKGVGWH